MAEQGENPIKQHPPRETPKEDRKSLAEAVAARKKRRENAPFVKGTITPDKEG